MTTADAEVALKASRRRFTAQYTLRILEKSDACSQPGELDDLVQYVRKAAETA